MTYHQVQNSDVVMVETTQWIYCTFKFGGFWSNIKNESRKKYEGGRQKTVKIEKTLLSYEVLLKEFEIICPWLRGCSHELYYHVSGTSPKEYKRVTVDSDWIEIVRGFNDYGRAEIVVALEEMVELQSNPNLREFEGNTLEYNPQNNDYVGDCVVEPLGCEIIDVRSISIGTRFIDSISFKHFLRSKAVVENFGLKMKSSDRTRVIAICSYRGCPWRIRGSLCADGMTFEVRKYNSSHLCPGVNRAGNKQATISWVAHEIQDMVKRQPDITPKQINNSLEATYGLSLSYMKLWRSREVARDQIFGTIDENYTWVPTLTFELLNRNPGSHIVYMLDDDDNSFKRLFVSFKVCIDGFIVGCRHLIGLDACHLKSKYLGVLLSATSLDGNNGLFTIAFAVVETESKKTWQWFLENLIQAFQIDIMPLAFISDMEKGLEQAIKHVFPNAEHRVCLRHLWKNIKKYYHCHDSSRIQSIVWTAANAFTTQEFEGKMQELCNLSPHLHSYLLNLPYKWSKSQFLIEIKNPYNTNNMAESFNSWVGEARNKPVVDLVDMIRGLLMEQRAKRHMNSSGWRGELVPFAEEYLREITTRKDHFIIRQSTSFKGEVEGKHERHELNIDTRECSCKSWQISGLPCIHAVAFIGTKEHQLWHIYVDEHYYVKRFRMAYEGAIATLPGKEQWIVQADVPRINVPKTLRPRGRPRKTRFRSFMEGTTKRVDKIHKCSRCGLQGHHKNNCKNPLKQSTETMAEVIQNSEDYFGSCGLL